MAKYYFTQLAGRTLQLSKRDFRFLICSQVSGRAIGVYEATDDEEIEILDRAVSERRGIKEIGLDEYEDLKKKATLTLQSPRRGASPPRSIVIPQTPLQPNPREIAMGKAGVVGAGFSNGSVEESIAAAPPIKSLIVVQKVNPPKPFATAEEKAKKSAKRSEAKIARVARSSIDSR